MKEVCDNIVKSYVHLQVHVPPDSSSVGDKVLECSKNLLGIGAFYLEYQEAIREGDGKRVLRCWQYLLPIFRYTGRRNYCGEALRLLHQYYYALPPRLAEQLIWSRFANTHGIRGKNIPLDFHQEHLNRLCKTAIKSLGPNRTDEAVLRCGKALGTISGVLRQFDQDNNISSPTGAHRRPSYGKDLNIMISALQKANVLVETPRRQHNSFTEHKEHSTC